MESVKSFFQSNREKVIALSAVVVLAAVLVTVNSKRSNDCPNPIPLDKNITGEQLSESPNSYKCKTVSITGRVFQVEKDTDGTALQIWSNPDKSEGNIVVYYGGDSGVGNDDYVRVTGWVGEPLEGENAFGGKVDANTIYATKVEKINRDEAVAPAAKTLLPNLTQSKDGLVITIQKIEIADSETRVYALVKNQGSKKKSFYGSSDLKLVQNGSQVKNKYQSDYADEIPSDLLPRTSETGKIYYEKVDPSKPFTLTYSGFTDTDYSEYTLTFQLNK